jgi:type I restriction enzyme S subunit
MASEWIQGALGDLIELKRGYDLPQQVRERGCIPIVSSSGISDFNSRAMVKGPGVVTGRYGTIGEVFYIEEDFWPLNTTLYVRDFKGNDPRFVNYFLKSVDYHSFSDKAAVPGVNRNHLHQAAICYPKAEAEQSHIANVLGAFDDKIELNRKMNETLETIARALFQSWFVDFAPVRARAEGRSTGLPEAIAALFPDSFEDSEFGEIPRGWKASTLYEIADFANGAAYRDMHFSKENAGLPVIKIAELKSGVTGSTRFTMTDLGDRYRLETKEILFSWSGNPDTSIDTFIWDGGPAWLNQHIFRVRENGRASRARIFSQLKALRPVFAEIARNKQTTGLGHVTIADMKRLMICEPSIEVAVAFDKYASPLMEQIISNQLQIRSLIAMRDALLPELISGEIRLDIEEERV